jgi:tRNA uridine 5-carbamoylmethylation protein Kti12
MTQQIICMRGYPKAGKTVAARDIILDDRRDVAIVSRDQLRLMMFDEDKVEPERERIITRVEMATAVTLLRSNMTVVIDDTNLARKHIRRFARLAESMAEENREVEFYIYSIETPLEKCLERNNYRPGSRLTDESIRRIAAEHPIDGWPTAEQIINEVQNRTTRRRSA